MQNIFKKNPITKWAIIIFSFVLLVFLGFWLFNRVFHPIPPTAAEFGDSFGVTNALFSACAFGAIIVGLIFQSEALKAQLTEVKNSNVQLEESNRFLGEQIEIFRKSNDANVVIDLFNEFRNKKWTKIRTKMNKAKKNGKILEFQEVKEYSHFLNHFGFLLEHEYVDVESIYQTFGRNVMEFWRIYQDDIKKERNHSNSMKDYYPYQYHLEYLDWRIRKYFNTGRGKIEHLLQKIHDWDENRPLEREDI
ncbi:MAG: hypothetical protein AAF554_02335 [Bacteroidota bacterium]